MTWSWSARAAAQGCGSSRGPSRSWAPWTRSPMRIRVAAWRRGSPDMADIATKAAEADQGWGTAYGRFGAVIEGRGLRIGAEVGVAFGGHAEALLSETSIERLYGVDPYKHFRGYDDPMNLPQHEFDELHDFTLGRLAPYGERYSHLRMTSVEGAQAVPRPIDFVFVDAV